jgi:DNA-binding SARP family transcriptional activator
VQFRILGPLEVVHAGEALSLGGAKQRKVLSLLILQAPESVSTDRLVDALWGERPPPTAQHAVQVYVSGIRKALRVEIGEASSDSVPLLETREQGYSLRLGGEHTLDRMAFEQHLVEGQRLLREGEPRQAAERLDQALSLWRGPAFGEFAGEHWAVAEARRLEELRAQALEAQVDTEFALGADEAAIPELERLINLYPDRERMRGQLMLALYRAGRQADALRVFRDTRQFLVDEYGIEPGEELRALNQAILSQDNARLTQAGTPLATAGSEYEVAAPVPTRLRPYGAAKFVGREREREELRSALASAEGGQRAGVLITGEPGVGKTRLVSEMAVEAHADGSLVLGGRCDEGLELPYQPFVEALEHLIEHAPPDLLRAHVESHGLAVARLNASLARRLGEASAPATAPSEAERYLLFAAIDGLLASAASSPVLLVLEDLHWADVPTVVLLKYILTSPRRARLAVVGTVRSVDLEEEHPLKQLLADLHREPRVARLELGGLSLEEVEALAGNMAGQELDPDGRALAERLHASTAGNPFFITELLRNLAESDVGTADEWRTSPTNGWGSLPTSITETLDRRLARLGSEARDCLGAAAAVGHEFDIDLLQSATETDHAELVQLLARAVDIGLVAGGESDGRTMRFAHALIDHWLYAQLGAPKRVELHRRIANRLEQRAETEQVSAPELARHWHAAAGTSEIDKPLRYALLAGDDALKRLAPDEARRWYARALDLHARRADPTDAERCEILVRRGEAEQQVGDPAFRDTLLEAADLARRTDDPKRLIRAALANTRGLQSSSGTVDEDRIAALDLAIEATGTQPSAERARLLATQAVELAFSGQWKRRVALSDEALALARSLDDPDTLANVLNLRFLTIWAPETHAERLANSGESIVACEQSRDQVALFHAYHWRTAAAIEAADPSEAQRCMAAERELADSVRQPTLLWLATCHDSDLALIEGRLDDAERLAGEALAIGQASEPDALACFAAQLTAIQHEQGRLGEQVGLLEQVVDANPGIPGFRAILARALCELGRTEEARQAISPSAESKFTDLPYDVTWLAVACIYADCVAQLGDENAARMLYGLLEPWRLMIAYPGFGVGASVSHWLAELAICLGDIDAAERHNAEAGRLHEQLTGPIWIARGEFQAGRLHRRRGRDAKAKDALGRSLEAAERLGMAGLASRGRALLEEADNSRVAT